MAEQKARKLGKLGIAIVEGFLEKKLGTRFVDELRKGHEEHQALIEAIANTEDRFRAEFEDREVTKAIFDDLSLDGLPSLKQAYAAFYKRPTDPELPMALRALFNTDFARTDSGRINAAIAFYLAVFKEELAQVDETFRENARAVSDFSREELLAQILAALETGLAAQRGADSPKIQALHQLPPLLADFTGRENEIQEILRAVNEGGATVFGVGGQGGIGKTTLALRVAHELAKDYPDGQIFVNLRGTDENNALSVNEAMRRVIHSFEPGMQLPEILEELSGLYLSILHGKQVLLLMDNAFNEMQVEPLVPPNTCLLLITSRQRFRLPGCETITLMQMGGEEATQLLLKIAPRIGDLAGQTAKLCGFLPLALRLAASMLADRKDIKVNEHIKKLGNEATRLEFVEASLALSYELLDDIRKAYWRKLAVFLDSFFAEAAAAIWLVTPEEAKKILWDLQNYSLVEWDEHTERYQLHDLAKLFAKSKLGRLEIEKIRGEHSSFYRDILSISNKYCLSGNQDLDFGLNLFDLERGNIEKGQRWAAANWERSSKAAELAQDYPNAGHFILILRLSAMERIEWLRTGISAAEKLGDQKSINLHLGNLGIAFAEIGEIHSAVNYYQRALAFFKDTDDNKTQGKILGNLGNGYLSIGEARKAIEVYEKALVINRETGDVRSEASTLGNLGMAYAALGEIQEAINYYLQDLDIVLRTGDRYGESNLLGNLSTAYANMGDIQKALKCAEQQLTLAREIRDRVIEGVAQGNLGTIYAQLNEINRAIGFYKGSLQIGRETHNRHGEATALSNLGVSYVKMGQNQIAIQHFQEALKKFREIGDRRGEGKTQRGFAVALRNLGRMTEALESARAALEICEAVEDPDIAIVRQTIQQWEKEAC